MSLVCKTKIEKAWLVASVTIFIVHRLLEASPSDYYLPNHPLRLWLELMMIALSFPFGGLAVLALQSVTFWCDDCRNLESLFDWPTLLFAGYIQWFWVLPEYLRSRKLTLLDLKRTPEIVSPENSHPAIVEPATHAPLASAPSVSLAAAAAPPDNAAPRPAFDANHFTPRLAEFDEAGLTALDRVFQAQRRPPAEGSLSHVEAIFPHVN